MLSMMKHITFFLSALHEENCHMFLSGSLSSLSSQPPTLFHQFLSWTIFFIFNDKPKETDDEQCVICSIIKRCVASLTPVERWLSYLMAFRGGCCCGFGPFNEDNARFLMLAVFIILYLLCGAAVFSALEQPMEAEAKERWGQRFEQFSQKYNLSKKELNNLLRNYEEANVAGIRVDTIRPRWDFTGAFYFVGTVVSTIGEICCSL